MNDRRGDGEQEFAEIEPTIADERVDGDDPAHDRTERSCPPRMPTSDDFSASCFVKYQASANVRPTRMTAAVSESESTPSLASSTIATNTPYTTHQSFSASSLARAAMRPSYRRSSEVDDDRAVIGDVLRVERAALLPLAAVHRARAGHPNVTSRFGR